MLEKMFTTKMSMDKKKLQNRFSKIRSKNGKTAKIAALVSFALIIVSIIAVSIYIAVNSLQDDAFRNAENMSFTQMEDLQRQADNGHFPWRLDYEQVIKSFLSGKGIDVEGGEIIAFAGDGEKCGATYSVNGNTYIVDLFKPIEKSEHGIWVVRSFEKKNSAIIQEVFFYKATPEQPMIEKEDDGWYKMSSVIDASFQYKGKEPDSVIAYFTPAGTEMDEYKIEVGKISAPYTYMTMAKVLSMQLHFPKDATRGHLHFVFNYDDGEEVKTEYYNVLMLEMSE